MRYDFPLSPGYTLKLSTPNHKQIKIAQTTGFIILGFKKLLYWFRYSRLDFKRINTPQDVQLFSFIPFLSFFIFFNNIQKQFYIQHIFLEKNTTVLMV